MFSLREMLKIAIEFIPLVAISTIIITLYVFGTFGLLLPTVLLLWFLGLASFAAFIYLLITKKGLIATYLTPGYVFYWLFIALVSYKIIPSYYHDWDDFSFWGYVSHYIYDTNGFITSTSNVGIKDYPFGVALFHYFLYQIHSFAEWKTYLGQNLILFAGFPILCAGMKWKNWVELTITLAFYVGIVLLGVLGITALQVDKILAIVFASALLVAIYPDNSKKFAFIVGLLCFLLPIIKHVGGMFSIIVGISYLASNKGKIDIRSRYHYAYKLFPLFSALLSIVLWKFRVYIFGFHHTYTIHTSLIDIVSQIFSNTTSSKTNLIIQNFFSYFSTRIISTHNVTYWIILSFIFALLSIIVVRNKKDYLVQLSIVGLGYIVFTFGLLVLYLTEFSEYEGTRGASFERYLNTYITAFLIFVFGYVLFNLHSLKNTARYIMGLILLTSVDYVILKGIDFNVAKIEYKQLDPDRAYVHKAALLIGPLLNNHRVLATWPKTSGLPHLKLIFELSLLTASNVSNYVPITFSKNPEKDDVWSQKITDAQLKEKLSYFDYFLILNSNESFMHEFNDTIDPNDAEKTIPGYDTYGNMLLFRTCKIVKTMKNCPN